jgi:hypothetical protein
MTGRGWPGLVSSGDRTGATVGPVNVDKVHGRLGCSLPSLVTRDFDGGSVTYNYPRFDEYVTSGLEAEEFGAFPGNLHVGESAPDATLSRLDDGDDVALADLWRSRLVVMEFGSFT